MLVHTLARHLDPRRGAVAVWCVALMAVLAVGSSSAAQSPDPGPPALEATQEQCAAAEAARSAGRHAARGPTCHDLLALHDAERAAANAALRGASAGPTLASARARYDEARAAYLGGIDRGRGPTCADVLVHHAREHALANRRVVRVHSRHGHDVTNPHPAAGSLPPCREGASGSAEAAACTAFLDALQRGGVRHLRFPPGIVWTHGVPMHDSLEVDGFGEAVVRLQPDIPRGQHGFFAADPARPLRGVRLRGFTQEGLRRARAGGTKQASTNVHDAPQHGLFVAAAEDLLLEASWTHNLDDGVRLGGETDAGYRGRAHRIHIVGGLFGWNGGSGLLVADADSLAVEGVTASENQLRAVSDSVAAPGYAAQIALAPGQAHARVHRVWIRNALVLNSVAGGVSADVRAPGASIAAVTLEGLRLLNDGSDARFAGRSRALVLASGNGTAAGPRAPIRNMVLRRVVIRGFGGVDGLPVISVEGGTDRAVIREVVISGLDADGRGYGSVDASPYLRARAVEGLLLHDSMLRTAGPAILLDSAQAVLDGTRVLPDRGYQLDVDETRPHVPPSVTVRGADDPTPAGDDTIKGWP